MNKEFGGQISQEIRRLETKDMNRRRIKQDGNEDKLFDFYKIRSIKQERQINSEGNSVRSSPQKSSSKISSSVHEYNLFDDQNRQQEDVVEILSESEDVQEIQPPQRESPKKQV